ncbi:MAG: phospholipase [Gemmatimonadota bacterium]|nr:phospholipase [Gemmatimonadota bacterium]
MSRAAGDDAGGGRVSRRAFIGALSMLAACRTAKLSPEDASVLGRIEARPRAPRRPNGAPLGMLPLGAASGRDGLIYVPPGYRADQPAPLIVTLHGSDSGAKEGIAPFLPLADDAGFILLAPESRARTWDIVLGAFGADVLFVNRAMIRVFDRYAIDPGRIAIEGFSDGASEALSVGLTNGELFTRIIAFSPGMVASTRGRGRPLIFDAHGETDNTFPIAMTSRTIVRQLRAKGYHIDAHEFAEGHTVPPAIAKQAIEWLAASWA